MTPAACGHTDLAWKVALLARPTASPWRPGGYWALATSCPCHQPTTTSPSHGYATSILCHQPGISILCHGSATSIPCHQPGVSIPCQGCAFTISLTVDVAPPPTCHQGDISVSLPWMWHLHFSVTSVTPPSHWHGGGTSVHLLPSWCFCPPAIDVAPPFPCQQGGISPCHSWVISITLPWRWLLCLLPMWHLHPTTVEVAPPPACHGGDTSHHPAMDVTPSGTHYGCATPIPSQASPGSVPDQCPVPRGAGTGGLGLAIEGPSEAKMSCKDNKDGSCTVEYIPFTAGDYDVNITFGGHPIPGAWWGWGWPGGVMGLWDPPGWLWDGDGFLGAGGWRWLCWPRVQPRGDPKPTLTPPMGWPHGYAGPRPTLTLCLVLVSPWSCRSHGHTDLVLCPC